MVAIKKKLIYLMHPDKESVFSAYGLPLEDRYHLVGLLMIDRPYRANDDWLYKVKEEFGDFHLAYMTHSEERGIACQMKIEKESRKFLKEMDYPLDEKIAKRLYPLLEYKPNPRFRMRWDDDTRMWLSEFDLQGDEDERKVRYRRQRIYSKNKNSQQPLPDLRLLVNTILGAAVLPELRLPGNRGMRRLQNKKGNARGEIFQRRAA